MVLGQDGISPVWKGVDAENHKSCQVFFPILFLHMVITKCYIQYYMVSVRYNEYRTKGIDYVNTRVDAEMFSCKV